MRTESTSSADLAAAVAPVIVCNQLDDVASVQPSEGWRVRVRFCDGSEGLVEMQELIQSDGAGVFAELRDPEVFAKVRVELGAVTWPGDIDLAPDTMYAAIRRDGSWTPR